MKKYFGNILIFILIAVSLYGQDKILVSVSPEIGTEVDREERDEYNWFQDVPNFISARFYCLADGNYEIQILFFQNGQVNEQERIITPEAFQEKYQTTLISQDIREKQEIRSRKRRSSPIIANRQQLINLRLSETEVKNVSIIGLEGDSVSVEKTQSTAHGLKVIKTNYSVADIQNISVVRNTNLGLTLGIGVAPGAIAALIHNNFTDDDYHKSERVRNIFYMGEVIGLSVSGTIAAMKSIDYDYVFNDLSYEQKHEKLNQFLKKGLRRKTYVRFSPWIGVYHFPNYLDNTILFPGVRLSICFSPRQRMEIMYGYSDVWSLQGKDFNIDHYGYVKEYTTFNLLKVGLRTDYTYNQSLNPFIAWGWGLLGKKYKTHYNSDQHFYYDEDNSNPDIILNIELGLEHHINRWVSVEVRIGIVENFDYGLHPMAQVGLHLGRFY